MQRALLDARRRGAADAIVLLGDLIEDPTDAGAERDLAALEQTIHDAAGNLPLIMVPGNHDGNADLVLSIFGDRPGPHEVRGYRLHSFLDGWDECDVCRRPREDMRRFAEEAGPRSDKPLIVLQHNPLHPPIESEYPYILADCESIMSAYSDAGVLLSLSGHYHAGQEPSRSGGVSYYTCPALCESPFRYAMVTLEGREVTVTEHPLRLAESPPLIDVHTHTHYAYCGAGVSAVEVIRRARLFGLAGVCLTEHADQLYLTRQEHTSGHVFEDPDFWCTPRSAESERMPRYRAEVGPLRNDFVSVGLEVELDADGRPALRDQHREGWDLLLGTVHWTPGGVEGLTASEVNRRFLRDTERILQSGVDVLAHPFRFFRRNKLAPPGELYRPVAVLLARYGAAAEINFHTNEPDPEFFTICIAEGVKIALGSDAHELREVADLHPHLAVLREAAGTEDVTDLLYPSRRP